MKVRKVWQEAPFNLFAEAVKVEPITSVGSGDGLLIQKEDVKRLAEDKVEKLPPEATPSKGVEDVRTAPVSEASTLAKSLLFTSCGDQKGLPTVVAFGTNSEAAKRWQGTDGLTFVSPTDGLENIPVKSLKKILKRAKSRKK